MWTIVNKNDNQLSYQLGSWEYRITLLLLPFILSILTFVFIKDDPFVIEHNALHILVFIIFLTSSLIFWAFLFSCNKKITFFKKPFSVKIERWWVIFTATSIFQLNSSFKILSRRETPLLSDDIVCNIYLVSPSKKICTFYLDSGLTNGFSKLETLLNFTGLELDASSNIVRKDTAGFEIIHQKSSVSLIVVILVFCGFVLCHYLIDRFL